MRWLAASAKAFAILLCAAVLVFGSARATNTILTAIVCAPSGGSVITLYQPVSDSVVNSPDIAVSGKVTQSAAVDISIDSVHRMAVSLDAANGTFGVVVPVSEGTHEIKVVSKDICNVQDGVVTSVITYRPDAVPSQGPKVPTVTTIQPAGVVKGAAVGYEGQELSVLPTMQEEKSNELVHDIIDESQPIKSVDMTPGIVAIPFVVGAGAFGWIHIHIRRFGSH